MGNIQDTLLYTPNRVRLWVYDEKGKLVQDSTGVNGRVQAGGVAAAAAQFGGTGITFKYVALSSTSGFSIANTDTTLSGEITTLGLSRTAGVVTLPTTQSAVNATCSTVIGATWYVTGSITIYGAGLFSASSGGTLGYEYVTSPTAVANGYTVNLSWTLNE